MRPERHRRVMRLEVLEGRLAPATFTVTNTDDSGSGSLRQAITDANNNSNSGGPDRIEFNVPGAGVHTIRPDFGLPGVQDPVVIDGYTQPGASPNTLAVGDNAVLLIEINGADAGEDSGLVIFAPDTTVRGLVVNGFRKGQSSTQGRGIVALGAAATNVAIAGNFVGVDPSGTAAVPNENVGVFVLEANGARIGGSDPADRNVISGNGIRGCSPTPPACRSRAITSAPTRRAPPPSATSSTASSSPRTPATRSAAQGSEKATSSRATASAASRSTGQQLLRPGQPDRRRGRRGHAAGQR
jgi:hypothetical protein